MKVLLVDDHTLFLDGLATLLTAGGVNVVGTANDGLEALEKARDLSPDIVVMDIQMPNYDGLTATRLIKTELPEIKIVMLTTTETDALLIEAFKSGASGFVLKNLDGDDFISLLEGIYADETSVTLDFPEYRQVLEELSPRQIQILTLVAGGMSYKQVAPVLGLSERTIKYHMGEIIAKLRLTNRNEAIALARRIGLGGDSLCITS